MVEVSVEGVVEVEVLGLVEVEVGVSLVSSESEGESFAAGEGAVAGADAFLAFTLTASFIPPSQWPGEAHMK